MAQTIKLKNSGTSTNTPSSLEHGELAINYADGKIFYKNSGNSIVEFTTTSGSFLPLSGGTLTGNLLIGTTSTNFADQGVIITDGQYVGTMDGSHCATYNRLSSDGQILRFFKDGLTVGSIGVLNSNNLTIGGNVADHSGIQFGTHSITPMEAGVDSQGTIDLGTANAKFKDLHLSGTISSGAITSTGLTVSNTGSNSFIKAQETTGAARLQLTNSGANILLGSDNSSGGLTGVANQAYMYSANPLKIGVNTFSAQQLTINSSGIDVLGSVTSTTGFTTGANTRVQSSSGMLFITGAAAIPFEVGVGSEKMRLTSTGLGIGTQVPARGLQIHKEGNHLSLTTTASGTAAGNGSDFKVDATTSDLQILNYESANTTFWTSGIERLRINADGSSVFSGSTSVTGSASANTSAITMGFTAPDGEIKVKNTTGAPASNLDFYTTNSSGTTAIAMRLTSDKDVSISRNLTMNGTLIGASSISCGAITSTGLTVSATGDAALLLQNSSQTLRLDQNSMRTTTNTPISFLTNSTLALTLSTSQNVNIPNGSLMVGSTTAPSATLDIRGTNTYNKIVSYFSGSYISGFKFSDLNGGIWYDAGTDDLTVSAGHANSKLILASGGSTALTFLSDQSASFSGAVTSTGLTVNGSATFVANSGANNLFIDGRSSDDIGQVTFRTNNGSSSYSQIQSRSNELKIKTLANIPMSLHTNNTERMRIDSSGNVKIGDSATDITSKLVVSGNASSNVATFMYDGAAGTFFDIDCNSANGIVNLSADARSGAYPPLVFTTGGGERMRIDSSGRLGIGTTSPSKILHLSDTSDSCQIMLTSSNSTTAGIIFGDSDDSATGHILYHHSDNALAFGGFNNTERMRIDSSGRLGISTIPSAWNNVFKAIEIGTGAAVTGRSDSPELRLVSNAYLNTSNNFIYKTSNAATMYTAVSGIHIWSNASVGTAGNTATMTERLRIDPQGALKIGGNSNSGFVDFDSVSLQLNTQRNPNTGAFVNTAKSHASITLRGDNGGSDIRFGTANANNTVATDRVKITSGGNLLIGKSADNDSDVGIRMQSTGHTSIVKSGGNCLTLNRLSSDGSLLDFRKDTGTVVGSIGTVNSNLYLGTANTGLYFNDSDDTVMPISVTTVAGRDNGVNLGKSDTRFKSLYLSNATIVASRTTFGSGGFWDNASNGNNVGVKTGGDHIFLTDGNGDIADGTKDIGIPSRRVRNLYLSGGVNNSTGLVSIGNTQANGIEVLTSTGSGQPRLRPAADNATDIGESAKRFKDIYSARAIIPKMGFDDVGIRFDNSFEAVVPYRPDTNADADDRMDLGRYNCRWDDVFATNGTIQTSDENEKQDIADLDEIEKKVAVKAKALLKKYRWKSAVEKKGDDARIHFGIIAQDLKQAFESEGLDAHRYGMFCSNTWTDEDGVEQTKMGVRYSELLAFIISTL